VDPQPRGPDWMKISPVAGFLFHEKEHSQAACLVRRYPGRTRSIFPRNIRIQPEARSDFVAKLLILLALPRGIEPLFSP
jgi:hypothetical protein